MLGMEDQAQWCPNSQQSSSPRSLGCCVPPCLPSLCPDYLGRFFLLSHSVLELQRARLLHGLDASSRDLVLRVLVLRDFDELSRARRRNNA